MTFEQLHFAIGASIPFIISLFLIKKDFFKYTPLIMTIFGLWAMIPYFLKLKGSFTNIFLFYNIIQNYFSKGQFIGYALIISMFTIIFLIQSFKIWREHG